jgi:hypothetical protein
MQRSECAWVEWSFPFGFEFWIMGRKAKGEQNEMEEGMSAME